MCFKRSPDGRFALQQIFNVFWVLFDFEFFIVRNELCGNVDANNRPDNAFELVPQIVGCEMITEQIRPIDLCKVSIQRGVVSRIPVINFQVDLIMISEIIIMVSGINMGQNDWEIYDVVITGAQWVWIFINWYTKFVIA